MEVKPQLASSNHTPFSALRSTLFAFCFLLSTFCFVSLSPAAPATNSFAETKAKAEKGDAKAQYTMGVMCFNGNGVTKDDAEAVKWFRKAADQGYAASQFNLGVMHASGRGVTKDYAEAVKWYRKAADQGLATAQSSLGVAYALGDGVGKDAAEAVKWFRKAADRGHADAQYNLGVAYALGDGVVKDEPEAYKWFLLAGAQGNENAKNYIPTIEEKLTSSQRAEGQKLAREWKPQHTHEKK